MTRTNTTKATTTEKPSVPTGQETRKALLGRAIRSTVPVRRAFVQAPRGSESRHGPLHEFVANGDLRGLRAYLLVVGATSAENSDGWTTTLDSAVWGRLLDADLTADPASARTAAWRTLGRLHDRKLITRARPRRGSSAISVTLLREDGSGNPYTRPDGKAVPDRFLRLPTKLWARGTEAKLSLPALAMLLVLAAEKPWTAFPAERMPGWYGWSADTTERGLRELLTENLAERREHYRTAPLTPTGSTLTHQYRLAAWLRPRAGTRPHQPEASANRDDPATRTSG